MPENISYYKTYTDITHNKGRPLLTVLYFILRSCVTGFYILQLYQRIFFLIHIIILLVCSGHFCMKLTQIFVTVAYSAVTLSL